MPVRALVSILAAEILLAACDGPQVWFPPADFREPIVAVTLEVGNGDHRDVQLTHRYEGLYLVELSFPKEPPLVGKVESSLRLSLKCQAEGLEEWETASSGPYAPFRSDEGGGLILMDYEVPQDLPKGRELSCEVDILQADRELVQRFGVPRLVIRNGTTL